MQRFRYDTVEKLCEREVIFESDMQISIPHLLKESLNKSSMGRLSGNRTGGIRNLFRRSSLWDSVFNWCYFARCETWRRTSHQTVGFAQTSSSLSDLKNRSYWSLWAESGEI